MINKHNLSRKLRHLDTGRFLLSCMHSFASSLLNQVQLGVIQIDRQVQNLSEKLLSPSLFFISCPEIYGMLWFIVGAHLMCYF